MSIQYLYQKYGSACASPAFFCAPYRWHQTMNPNLAPYILAVKYDGNLTYSDKSGMIIRDAKSQGEYAYVSNVCLRNLILVSSMNILFSVLTELSLQRCKGTEGWLSIKLRIHGRHFMLLKHGKVQPLVTYDNDKKANWALWYKNK